MPTQTRVFTQVAALAAEAAAIDPVVRYMANHERLDWPNVRLPQLIALASQARDAEARGDLEGLERAWAEWAAGIWAQLPGEVLSCGEFA